MSAYIRAAKPILRYLGTRLITMRSRMRSRRGKLRRTMSGRSSAAPGGVEQDGTRHIAFRFGRPRKTNLKGVTRMQRKLAPINTHIIGSMQSLVEPTSGYAHWTLFKIATPTDVVDILNKAIPVYTADYKLNADVNQLPVNTTLNGVGAPTGPIQALLSNVQVNGFVNTSQALSVDVSSLQQQINNIASRVGIGAVSSNYDGRFVVYSHDTYLEMKNQLKTAVTLTVYECIPRENIMQTTTWINLEGMMNYGFNRKNAAQVSAYNPPAKEADNTLYMNPVWCHNFFIERARTVTLKAGEVLKLHMTHGHPRVINPMVLGSEMPYLALRNFTRCLVIKQVGSLVSNGADLSLVDTSSTSIDVKITTKYRWNALPNQVEMVTKTVPTARGWAHGDEAAMNPASGQAEFEDEDPAPPSIVNGVVNNPHN